MDFDDYPQPESNDSNTVAIALEALRSARDELSATDACDAFLWSVGNNQAGTFYPVVLGTLSCIKEILVNGNAWAQRAVMESLIDLGGTFVPEARHVTYQGKKVQDELNEFIRSLRPSIVPLAMAQDGRANIANELLELIEDRAA
jgi:hypothetical protein